MYRRLISVSFLCLFFVGCATIGPPSVHRDRFDYNTAISDSWKEQTLLNIVKLRYADMPLFIEVASIVSGYTLESAVSLSGVVFDGSTVPASASLGGSGKYTDRPTITYAPITGSHFNKTFMTPVQPSALLFLLQSGWPAEIVLPITLEAINGLRAQKSAGTQQRRGESGYYRVIELFSLLQKAGVLGMRVERNKDSKESAVLIIRQHDLAPEIDALGVELTQLLGLRRGSREYSVAYGELAKNDTELALLSRSTLSIMVELAGQIRVPQQHVDEGRSVPSILHADDKTAESRRLIDIHSTKDKPDDAFVSVNYRDYWYWIDDRDFKSKRTFAYLMLLFSLTESGGKEGLPLVTIPAG